MGEVWEARQEEPVQRRVALKLVKLGLGSKEVLARFESERQALAVMDHPAIAKVLDAGVTEEGRPYFVMEYIAGVPLTEYCDRHRLTVGERLRLFREVCEGVQHAHQKAIIHRDLKPSNVLVTVQDGKPVPKIIDFGVAKATAARLTERTLFTEVGQLIGTPEYMSPEQAEMSGENIDTRTDVYSLGAMLYELLVGARVFERAELREAAFDEIRRTIREVDPPRPSTRVLSLGQVLSTAAHLRRTTVPGLKGQLHGDLDWIVMKALEKDRTHRYGSPAELAADIERHLGHEPVRARQPSTRYRMAKFVRRHRVGVAAASVVVAALVVGVVAATWGFVRARRAETKAKLEAATAEQVAGFLVDIFKTSDPRQKDRGADVTARELLARASERIDDLSEQPVVQARMLYALAEVHQQLGVYQEALPMALRSLELRKRMLGAKHPEVLKSLQQTASLQFIAGEYSVGQSTCREGLALARGLGDDAALAGLLNTMSNYLVRLDADPAEMKACRQESLAILRRIYGNEDPRVADALVNNSSFAETPAEFVAMNREAWEIERKAYGNDDPRTISQANNLAETYFDEDRLDEADSLLQASLPAAMRVLGADHPITITALADVAAVQRLRGDYAAAEVSYREVLTRRKRALGPTHPLTMRATWQVARALVQRGRFAEGDVFAREALEIGRQSPPGDENLAEAWYWLAGALDGQGRKAEAETALRSSITYHDKSGDIGSQDCPALNALARMLAARGKYAEAESTFAKSLRALRGDPVPYPRVRRETLEAIESFYEARAKAEPGSRYTEDAGRYRAELAAMPPTH
jgi:non-specific serine/threonine protein kinase/serine/threonine-protein kinase